MSDKTFLFGRSDEPGKKNPGDFFFELAAKPRLQHYSRVADKPAPAENPLKAVMEYSQVLIAAKRITLPRE